MRAAAFLLTLTVSPAWSEIKENPGGKRLPHDRYIHVVPASEAPVEQVYVKSKDGLYIAAAIRKPKGAGPFPALLYFHGAPGGRGMEKLVTWSRGDTGGPLWERFLKEGFAVIVADYRNNVNREDDIIGRIKDRTTYADDGISVLQYVRKLPYVNSNRIVVYGVSRGGNLALHLLSRETVAGAILGAPAPAGFLGAPRQGPVTIDPGLAKSNIEPINTPILIFVGTRDGLIELDRRLYNELARAGKKVRLEIYENGYHDFVAGPQGHEGRDEPLMDSTLDALDKAVAFAKQVTEL
jgi:dipeptidyl aminopeptidase/acylaminoacyl peptidase